MHSARSPGRLRANRSFNLYYIVGPTAWLQDLEACAEPGQRLPDQPRNKGHIILHRNLCEARDLAAEAGREPLTHFLQLHLEDADLLEEFIQGNAWRGHKGIEVGRLYMRYRPHLQELPPHLQRAGIVGPQ
jgi:hypothetical protein